MLKCRNKSRVIYLLESLVVVVSIDLFESSCLFALVGISRSSNH
jgi:hypothetical protein